MLPNIEAYLEKLDEFEDLQEAWSNEKNKHDRVVLGAKRVFDTVLGPRVQVFVQDVRREKGLSAAWQHVVERYSPQKKIIEPDTLSCVEPAP